MSNAFAALADGSDDDNSRSVTPTPTPPRSPTGSRPSTPPNAKDGAGATDEKDAKKAKKSKKDRMSEWQQQKNTKNKGRARRGGAIPARGRGAGRGGRRRLTITAASSRQFEFAQPDWKQEDDVLNAFPAKLRTASGQTPVQLPAGAAVAAAGAPVAVKGDNKHHADGAEPAARAGSNAPPAVAAHFAAVAAVPEDAKPWPPALAIANAKAKLTALKPSDYTALVTGVEQALSSMFDKLKALTPSLAEGNRIQPVFIDPLENQNSNPAGANEYMNDKVLIINGGGTLVSVPTGPRGALSPSDDPTHLLTEMKKHDAFTKLEVKYEVKTLPGGTFDSSDMKPRDWFRLALFIARHWHEYKGFVIVHGTDTLAYTAAALTFLIHHPTKPIVITGSQIPLCKPHTDAVNNLYGAILFAGHKQNIPEVCVYFHGKLMIGSRVYKNSSDSWDAFKSRAGPIAILEGEEPNISTEMVRRLLISRWRSMLWRHHKINMNHHELLFTFDGGPYPWVTAGAALRSYPLAELRKIHFTKKFAVLRLYPGFDVSLFDGLLAAPADALAGAADAKAAAANKPADAKAADSKAAGVGPAVADDDIVDTVDEDESAACPDTDNADNKSDAVGAENEDSELDTASEDSQVEDGGNRTMKLKGLRYTRDYQQNEAAWKLDTEGEFMGGFVIQSFGSGNGPSDPAFQSWILRALAANMFVCHVSECIDGRVSAVYHNGLGESFSLPLDNMTVEAAYAKMVVLVSNFPRLAALERMIRNERGEVDKAGSARFQDATVGRGR